MICKLMPLLMLPLSAVLLAQTPEAQPTSQPAEGGLKVVCVMETTLGNITLELDGDKAPVTVQNFVQYAEDGYYAGTVFHRVKPNFMIQGGGFTEEMKPKDGLRDPILIESSNGLSNVPGTIAMARRGEPNSATSQFFINVVDNSRTLDYPTRGGYTVFGKVTDGMETVEKIRTTECTVHPDYRTREGAVTPAEAVVIKSVKVTNEFDRQKLNALASAAIAKVEAEQQAAEAAKEQELQDYITKTEAEFGKKFESHESGLQYMVLTEGQGDAMPSPTDRVEVHYTGWLLDGTKFDSSVDRGRPATFPLNGVIKGWTVGVGLMKVGEKRRLIIPSNLGYGKRGSPPRIPPDATLVFDVELLAIQ